MLYPSSRFILATLFVLLLSACASSQTSESSQSDSSETKNMPSPPPPAIAPGTANVRAEILSVNQSDSDLWVVNARIQRVLEYGSSTPVLTPSQEITIRMKLADVEETDRPVLKKGNRIEWNIKFESNMMGASGAGYWYFRKDLEKP